MFKALHQQTYDETLWSTGWCISKFPLYLVCAKFANPPGVLHKVGVHIPTLGNFTFNFNNIPKSEVL
jgi:hypothetical protein